MSVDRSLLHAIGRAVDGAGGDLADVQDLAHVWERLERNMQSRVARMRHEAATARCACADGGEPFADGRSSRCWGRVS